MIIHDTPTSGELIVDLLIIATVWFSDKIYDCILFIITQGQIQDALIDLKDLFGVIVGIMGMILMYIKIKKAKKK